MITTKQEETRETRKRQVLAEFSMGETLYTNQIARALDVVWPVASRLLQELVAENKLSGNKEDGYRLYEQPKKNLWKRLKDAIKI